MKRVFVFFLLGLAACGGPETVKPPGGVPDCLKNDSVIRFSLGESVSQPTGDRAFATVLPTPGSYELAIVGIPFYTGLLTAVYQNNTFTPIKSTFTKVYSPTLRVSFEAEAGPLDLEINHSLPRSDWTCDTYTFKLEARP